MTGPTNKKFNFLALLILGSLLISCNQGKFYYEDKFSASYKAWENFKEASGNSYQYTETRSSWVGLRWETTISVSKGKVTERAFRYTQIADEFFESIPENEREWVENESELNTHPNSSAAKTLTMDEVYEKARKEWLIKREDAKVYFETDENGLLAHCGYVPEGCMDDCFVGITITSIAALE